MIDTFLKVIDRLIQLAQYKDQRLRRVFDEILTPIFEDLESIHNDYDKIFEETRALLPSKEAGLKLFNENAHNDPLILLLPSSVEARSIENKKQYTDALENLSEKRKVFEPVRIKLRAMLPELRNINVGDEAQNFIAAVIDYFPSGINKEFGDMSDWSDPSVSAGIKRYMKHMLGSSAIDYFEIGDLINYALYFNRENWEEVCRSYAKLKVRAISAA